MTLFRNRLKIILPLMTILATLLIIPVAGAWFSLEEKMNQTFAQKQLLQPTEFYAQGYLLQPRQILTYEKVKAAFEQLNYRQRDPGQVLLPGDWVWHDAQTCLAQHTFENTVDIKYCLQFFDRRGSIEKPQETMYILTLDTQDLISGLYQGHIQNSIPFVQLEPQRFAQYVGHEPLMQERAPLGSFPTACLNAIMAIEDQHFLEHKGYSVTGIGRAVVKNIFGGFKSQGGSTITQQLVKNYFLTPEKSFKRKIQELGMAIILESKLTKDEILEAYLNEIYLGQNGAFRVHGYPSASRYYFNKTISELDLSECALLAAIVNNPGRYNPWRNPEPAKKRRELVLSKMLQLQLISEEEQKKALASSLPVFVQQSRVNETAPYFIDAVRKQIQELGLPLEGSKIYTSLNLEAQTIAQKALQSHLEQLEKNNAFIKKNKEKKLQLEGLVLSASPRTGLIEVVVGGRNFRMTQFNRAIDSRRQVGSVFKPLVFLTVLEHGGREIASYRPWTMLTDEKKTYKYEGQSWSPENYENKYYGEVPLVFALKNSLNLPTVQVAMDVGLEKIIATAKSLGVESELKPVPSLSLGAFELRPKEVLQIATAFANLGPRPNLSTIQKMSDAQGQVLYEHKVEFQDTVNPLAVAELVSMMKQTLISGTARASQILGFTAPAAGKTGTTNDNKDTWFYGFTPYMATVVWVGYDQNQQTKLTGGSGSVPIWTEFMKTYGAKFPPDDFAWPTELQKRTIDAVAPDVNSYEIMARPE